MPGIEAVIGGKISLNARGSYKSIHELQSRGSMYAGLVE
jgi:hypothetical protein